MYVSGKGPPACVVEGNMKIKDDRDCDRRPCARGRPLEQHRSRFPMRAFSTSGRQRRGLESAAGAATRERQPSSSRSPLVFLRLLFIESFHHSDIGHGQATQL